MTMPTAIQVFRKFVATLSERYAPGEIYAGTGLDHALNSPILHLSSLLEQLESVREPGRRPFKYCAGLICSIKPTGYSSHLYDHFCLGVTTSMYSCCLEASLRYFQSEHAFREVGRWQQAQSDIDQDGLPKPWGFKWRDELSAWLAQNPQAYHDDTTFDAWDVPRYAEALTIDCPLRKACAGYIAQMMVKYLWTHEFGHIISGHLLYLKHKEREEVETLSESDCWFEKSQDVKYLDNAIRLWMEHDADTCAVNTLITANLHGLVIHRMGVDVIDNSRDLRLRLEVIAIVLVLLIIYFQHEEQDPSNATHPQPLQRIYASVISAITLITENHPEPARIVSQIRGDILGLARASAFHKSLVPLFFVPLTSEIAMREYNDLVAQVDSVIPEIRAFSYFDADGLFEAPAPRDGS